MTDLKNYDLAENMISPDDLKQSEQHGADRLNTQSEIAEGRVKEISVDRTTTGPGAGGLDQFFDEFEYRTWTNEMPWELADQVSTRVMNIVGQSALEYQNSLQGSSAAILEKQMLKYTRGPVLAKIQDVRAGGIHSLQTLETLKGFTAKAQAEAIAQRSDMETKQAEAIENRGWWSRAGHTALAIGTFGAYKLVETKKRQKWYNSIVEKSMTRQFDKINKNIEVMEGRVGKQIAPMQSRIRRTLAGEADPSEKANYKDALMAALRHTRDIGTIDLTLWGIANDAHQQKIDFLEAAQGLDFVKKDLGIVGVSSAKNLQQKQMIESAQEQQNVFNSTTKFAEVRDEIKNEGISSSEKSPSLAELVKDIENDFNSSSVEVEGSIYGDRVKKADLLTDSARFILLINFLGNNTLRHSQLQPKTRQNLLTWIEKKDSETAGGVIEYNNNSVKAELNVLQSTNGVVDNLVTELQNLKNIDEATDFFHYSGTIEGIGKNTQIKYQKFLNKEGDKNFPSEDFALIKDAWAPILEARKFLLEQLPKWEDEQESYKKHLLDTDPKRDGELKKLNEEIALLDGPDGELRSIKHAIKERNDYGGTSTAQINTLFAAVEARIKERDTKAEKAKGLLEKKAPSFSGMSKIQDLLDKLQIEKTQDYKKRIKKESTALSLDVNERILQTLRADDFPEEIDKKFVEQLEKNDQFEQLKNVSKGTKVAITYKKTAASSLRFPDQLGGSTTANFIVVESNEKGVLLEKVGGGETIAILGTAAKGGVAYKNAKIATTHSDNPLLPRDPSNPTVSGAWDSAIALNYKIS